MGAGALIAAWALPSAAALGAGAYLFWRHWWFWRNPRRTPPPGEGILSPADGTVVYVRRMEPGDEVVVSKRGRAARVSDITRQDMAGPKHLVGVFMSPFDVHYNRAPVSGEVAAVSHYPALTRNRHMGSMHLRSALRLLPIHANSPHIVENERTVTRFDGRVAGGALSCYVIQIAGGSVCGIESSVPVGGGVERGQVFGMIRLGSQVDVVVPALPHLEPTVRPGERVRAGETVLFKVKGVHPEVASAAPSTATTRDTEDIKS